MSMQSARESEIRDIAIAANSGEVTDEQIARLDELVRFDWQLSTYAVRLLEQQASLAWLSVTGSCASPTHASDLAERAHASSIRVRLFLQANRSWVWPTIAVGIGFIWGGLSTTVLDRSTQSSAQPLAASDSPAAAEPQYEARLVSSTACLCDGKSMGSRQIGSDLASGESLHLLEGLAEFKLNWAVSGRATVSLEGPAAIMLTSEGMPTLRFGRLTVTISTAPRPFVLETPVGRLVVAEYGSVRASTFGNEGKFTSLMARRFRAGLASAGRRFDALEMEAGQSIRAQPGDDGQPSITHHPADSDYFAAQVSMASDGLAISPAYVRAVKKAEPIGEGFAGGLG